MNKSTAIIILGTAHRKREPGKQSPDGKLKEYLYSREICSEIAVKLAALDYKAEVDYMAEDLPKSMQSPSVSLERSRELGMRANYVNEVCKQNGKDNVLYVSIHLNAAGADGKWHTAGGFSVYTSKGKTKADILAECIYNRAATNLMEYTKLMTQGKKLGYYDSKQKPLRTDTSDGDKDLEADFSILRNTNCPAVLAECMFQDNKSDVQFLMSDEGKHALIRTFVEGIIDYIQKS